MVGGRVRESLKRSVMSPCNQSPTAVSGRAGPARWTNGSGRTGAAQPMRCTTFSWRRASFLGSTKGRASPLPHFMHTRSKSRRSRTRTHNTHAQSYTHSVMHTHIHTQPCIHIHTHKLTHTYTHSHTRLHMQTHIHT